MTTMTLNRRFAAAYPDTENAWPILCLIPDIGLHTIKYRAGFAIVPHGPGTRCGIILNFAGRREGALAARSDDKTSNGMKG